MEGKIALEERQATSSKGVNNGFENMVGVSSALR